MQQRITTVFFICCLIFAIVIYFPSALYFLSDDLIHIPLSDKGELFQRNSVRPVHDILLSFDIFLWGKNAVGFHITALMVHLFCALALCWTTRSLFTRYKILDKAKAMQACVLASGLFLIYAFHSEAVLWILGSGAALCTLFFLLSISCYLQKERSFYFFLASLIFFQLGLFTYEAIWIAPLCIICFYFLDVFLLNRDWRNELIWMLLYIISFIGYLLLRIMIVGQLANAYQLGSKSSVSASNLFLNYNSLLARSFLPPMHSSIMLLCCYGLIAVLLILYLLKNKKYHNAFTFSLLCLFLLSLTPYIFLGLDTHTRESERFLYLPSTLLCVFTGYTLIKANLSNKLLVSILIIVFAYNAIFAYANRRDYNVAGKISKVIFEDVNNMAKSGKTVTIHNLPEQFNGVPIFRQGFKEGLEWLFHADTSKIKVVNKPMLIGTSTYAQNFFQQNFEISIKTENDSTGNTALTILPDKNYFTFLSDSTAISKYYRTIPFR